MDRIALQTAKTHLSDLSMQSIKRAWDAVPEEEINKVNQAGGIGPLNAAGQYPEKLFNFIGSIAQLSDWRRFTEIINWHKDKTKAPTSQPLKEKVAELKSSLEKISTNDTEQLRSLQQSICSDAQVPKSILDFIDAMVNIFGSSKNVLRVFSCHGLDNKVYLQAENRRNDGVDLNDIFLTNYSKPGSINIRKLHSEASSDPSEKKHETEIELDIPGLDEKDFPNKPYRVSMTAPDYENSSLIKLFIKGALSTSAHFSTRSGTELYNWVTRFFLDSIDKTERDFINSQSQP